MGFGFEVEFGKKSVVFLKCESVSLVFWKVERRRGCLSVGWCCVGFSLSCVEWVDV